MQRHQFPSIVGLLAVVVLALPAEAEPTKCSDMYAELNNFRRVHNAKSSFEKLIDYITGRKTKVTSKKAKAASEARNKKTLEDIQNFHPTAVGKSGEIGLSNSAVSGLYETASTHPVASLEVLERYNAGRGVGFCFGRAMMVHLEALFVHGLHNSQIKKLWVVGDMGRWQFHVTTAVYTKEKGWMAIDPIMGEPLPVAEWYRRMKAQDVKGDLLLFETEAKRFGPNATEYRKYGLEDPFYNEYFVDLLNYYKKIFNDEN